MNMLSRLTRSPRPHDPEIGRAALAHYPGQPPGMAGLIAGTAGCSPYLSGLLAQEAGWLTAAFDDPEGAVETLLAGLGAVPPDQLAAALRQGKRRIAALVALADLGGVWPLETVTQVLTDLADRACDVALRQLVAAEIARGKLPGLAEADAETAGGMVVLAMGKMGAGELNYSSDIDLICLFDETRFDPDDYHDARAALIRVTRRLTAILSDVTAEGYVFRTDLRLRPDASVTPVCLSMEAAERYYESVGRTWERAAYIKARPCAGDLAAGARFLTGLSPFVWRKHLDFAAIQDAHDMRLRIRDHKGLRGGLVLEGHNMKLGRGGIREIEFFTQTRQLIAGGRDPSLRVRQTGLGLERLAAAGWVSDQDAETLYDHYRFHREVEHRVQMVQRRPDPYSCPTRPKASRGWPPSWAATWTICASDLTDRLTEVHDLTEGFFAPGPTAPLPKGDFGAEVTARWRHLSGAAFGPRGRDLPPPAARPAGAPAGGGQAGRGAGPVRRSSWPGCPPGCSCSRCSRPIRS